MIFGQLSFGQVTPNLRDKLVLVGYRQFLTRFFLSFFFFRFKFDWRRQFQAFEQVWSLIRVGQSA